MQRIAIKFGMVVIDLEESASSIDEVPQKRIWGDKSKLSIIYEATS